MLREEKIEKVNWKLPYYQRWHSSVSSLATQWASFFARRFFQTADFRFSAQINALISVACTAWINGPLLNIKQPSPYSFHLNTHTHEKAKHVNQTSNSTFLESLTKSKPSSWSARWQRRLRRSSSRRRWILRFRRRFWSRKMRSCGKYSID